MNNNNYNESTKKIITTNKESKRRILLKVIFFSITFGFICGLLSYGMTVYPLILIYHAPIMPGWILSLINNNPVILRTIMAVLIMGLSTWFFIKSPNLKKMWVRILMSVGIMLILFTLAVVFYQLILYSLHPEYISNPFDAVDVVFWILLLLGIGLITGSYFLRKS